MHSHSLIIQEALFFGSRYFLYRSKRRSDSFLAATCKNSSNSRCKNSHVDPFLFSKKKFVVAFQLKVRKKRRQFSHHILRSKDGHRYINGRKVIKKVTSRSQNLEKSPILGPPHSTLKNARMKWLKDFFFSNFLKLGIFKSVILNQQISQGKY